MPLIYKDKYRFEEVVLPYSIYLERRQSVRMSIARTQGILRLPYWFSKNRIRKEHQKFLDWSRMQLEKSMGIRSRFTPTHLEDGSPLHIMNTDFEQQLIFDPTLKKHRLILDPETKVLKIQYPSDEVFEILPKLKSDLFSKYYLKDIQDEVAHLNREHFGFEYNSVRLKYNKSNWGSCSSKLNINLSSRVLLLPDQVRRYIIIHELAHLKEMNHSKAFWNVVASAMPNYDQAERWLKKEGAKVDF